jgi:hypothetical protein
MTKMPEINLFDMIKYDCKTHPHDVIVIRSDKRYGVYYENYNDDADHDTLREVVESQDCNWLWYCEYYDYNPLDEKWGRY